jgi:hypothetical protein
MNGAQTSLVGRVVRLDEWGTGFLGTSQAEPLVTNELCKKVLVEGARL